MLFSKQLDEKTAGSTVVFIATTVVYLHNGWWWYQVGCIGCIANTGIKISVNKSILLGFCRELVGKMGYDLKQIGVGSCTYQRNSFRFPVFHPDYKKIGQNMAFVVPGIFPF